MTPTVREKPEEPSRGHEGHEESPGCLAWGLFPLLETQFQLDGEVGAGKHMSRDPLSTAEEKDSGKTPVGLEGHSPGGPGGQRSSSPTPTRWVPAGRSYEQAGKPAQASVSSLFSTVIMYNFDEK